MYVHKDNRITKSYMNHLLVLHALALLTTNTLSMKYASFFIELSHRLFVLPRVNNVYMAIKLLWHKTRTNTTLHGKEAV